MESSSTRSSSSRRAGLPQGDLVEELPGKLPLSQHSMARLSLPGNTPRQDMALTGDPTSSLPSLPPCRQLCCCCHTHSTHLSPRSRAASLSAAASSRTKGFLCLLRGESALLTADRPLSAAPSSCISPAPSPADQGLLAMGSGHQHSSPSPSHLPPNQGGKQHPGLVSTNELSQQHTQHQHKPCLTARPELA